jgi:hypothetical protein
MGRYTCVFSPAVYAEFNPDWKQQIGEPDKHDAQEFLVTLKGERKPYSPRRTTFHLD